MIDKVAQVRVEPTRGRQLDLTVLIPTRNEAGNIAQVLAGLSTTGQSFDVLFVDDSDDDTPQVIRNCAASSPLRVGVLHRPAGERAGGLGGAVLAGLGSVSTAWVVVMDGDLQHPPELAARLATIGEDRDVDLVVASRNIGSGDSAGLSGRVRHTVSGSATLLGRVLFPRRLGRCTDPLSGFFALRRSAVDLTTLRLDGFKILVEILVRNPWLRLAEVPVRLGQRQTGRARRRWAWDCASGGGSRSCA